MQELENQVPNVVVHSQVFLSIFFLILVLRQSYNVKKALCEWD